MSKLLDFKNFSERMRIHVEEMILPKGSYSLLREALLVSDTTRGPVCLGFPVDMVERWFPLLYPASK